MLRALSCCALAVSLSACPPPPVSEPDAGNPDASTVFDAGVTDAGTSSDAGAPDAGDPTAALFAPAHLLEVRVDLPTASWDTLRNQSRDLFTLLTGNCTAQPFPSPFTEFESTVTVDGTAYSRVSVKKKGFLGSLSNNRPSLKLKLDAFISGQTTYGSDTLTLNNAQQDPAVLRQCLGYALFAKAGLYAPRCNYAHVTVNGVDLGVYANVEGIDKDFVRRRFDKASGNLYEGQLSDFSATYVNTFDLKGSNTNRADLQAVIDALTASDAEVVTRLSTVIDFDQFIDFWAMETLLRHWDGYSSNTNNFFLYDDPTRGKFVFVPWGADAVFYMGAATPDQPDGPFLRSELARRLYSLPDVKARYLARVRALLDAVFNEPALRTEVTRMDALVRPHLHPIQLAQYDAGLAELRQFIDTRRATLTAALVNPPAPPNAARPSPCMYRLGTFRSAFATTWGTLGAPDPFSTGPATFELTLDGGLEPGVISGASAGLDTMGNDGPKPGINLVTGRYDGGFTATVVRFDPRLYPTVGPQTFDFGTRVAYVLRYSGGVVQPIGLLSGGFTLSDAGVSDGGAVAGNIDAEVLSWPFGGGM